MKVGDKVYCHKEIGLNNKGSYYDIISLYDNRITITTELDPNRELNNWRLFYIHTQIDQWSKFSDHFITINEQRKQKLKKIKSLRKKETSLESVIIGHASKIFVTSKIWKEMLGNRFKQINNNIKILTNAYPEFKFSNNIENREKITLLYTGRFTGSSKKRRLDLLLNPLYYALKENNTEIEITFLSDLRREEFKSFEDWKKKFDSHNISLNLYKYLPRIKMFEFIEQSSGLLLLSAGYGPLPSKLFEYIKSSKPIFAVTPKGSAVWQLSEKLPQLFLYDYTNVIKDYTPIERFLIACKMKNYDYKIPNEFTEEFLSKIFLSELESLFTRVKI